MFKRAALVLASGALAVLMGSGVAMASVTQPLFGTPFPDGTTATGSWTVDSNNGKLQAVTLNVPPGHSCTMTMYDPGGQVVFTNTATGNVSGDQVFTTPSLPVHKNSKFSLQFSCN